LIECEIFDIAFGVANAIAHFFIYAHVYTFTSDLDEAIAANKTITTI
jgi:hypothetical protein